MPEHYTRNTESVTVWCNKCQKNTVHRVDGGRRGPCLDPAHPTPAKPAKKTKPVEKNLFEP